MPKPILTPLERFRSKIKPQQVNDCWEWGAYKDPAGYGRFSLEGHCIPAHRASWTLHNGNIPTGKDVLHKCDNPPCVNPDHLFLGDDFVNQRDRVAKGRHKGVARDQRGEENKMAKLSENDVRDIREIYATGHMSQKTIGLSYGVKQSLVSQIVNRKVWTHI